MSTASKLSGKVRPPNSIGITQEAYDRGLAASEGSIAWQKRTLQIGGNHRKVMLAEPSA